MTVKTIIYTNILKNIVSDLHQSSVSEPKINQLLTNSRAAVFSTTDPVSLSAALDTFGLRTQALKNEAAEAMEHRNAERIDHPEVSRNAPASRSDDRAIDMDHSQHWQQKLTAAKKASHHIDSKASHHQEILTAGRAFSSLRPNKTPKQKIIAAFDAIIASRGIDQSGLLIHQQR